MSEEIQNIDPELLQQSIEFENIAVSFMSSITFER